ncbi:MAG: HAD family phosphatase [Dehalococcoidia bacterium]|nr:HAD family phosphatase [Dehalococcoidia bacterium]
MPEARPHTVRALIFDMDGVLADTEPIFFQATVAAITPHSMTLEDYERFIGTDGLEDWLAETYGLPLDLIDTHIILAYFETLGRGLPAFPGAVEVIEAASARGLAIAVASMSGHRAIELTLTATGLRHYFPLVVSASDVGRGKPAPDIYLHTARVLGVLPDHCLVIEDSVHGIEAALAAGMRVVQSRQATFVPPPHANAHAVIESLEGFNHAWLDGEALG